MTFSGKAGSLMLVASGGTSLGLAFTSFMESISQNATAWGLLLSAFVAVSGYLLKRKGIAQELDHQLRMERIEAEKKSEDEEKA